jgi:hypothetical protein
MRKVVLAALTMAVALVVLGAQALTAGDNKTNFKADTLNGYQEAAGAGAAGLSSGGTGELEMKLDEDAQVIEWELTYTGLSAAASVAHIHFGNRSTSGGVSVFFCGGGTKPAACPPGTTDVAELSGTFVPSDVGGPAGQGIAAGEWDEFVAALRAGMMYANIHNSMFPGGEIRAQINNKDQKQPA